MKQIFGNVEYVLKHPHKIALMVAIMYGGFTNEELKEIRSMAEYLVWKRKNGTETKRCSNGKDNY